MIRHFCLLSSCLLVACGNQDAGNISASKHQNVASAAPNAVNQVSASEPASGPPALVQARFFVDPANSQVDIPSIRENMNPTATMNGHYSLAVVPCGTGCLSFWLVDRHTGGIIGIPAGSGDDDEVEYDVQGRLDSDIIRVFYGQVGLLADECTVREFRLTGTTLSAIGEATTAPCPDGP